MFTTQNSALYDSGSESESQIEDNHGLDPAASYTLPSPSASTGLDTPCDLPSGPLDIGSLLRSGRLHTLPQSIKLKLYSRYQITPNLCTVVRLSGCKVIHGYITALRTTVPTAPSDVRQQKLGVLNKPFKAIFHF